MSKTALIIGAGPAGLTAAYELLKHTDIKPVVLEETPFIGGISRTAEYNGNRMDIGGHRFFTKDKLVQQIWDEVYPEMLTRQRSSRIYYLRKFFAYPVTLNMQTLKNMGLGRTIKVGFGYATTLVYKRKETNLENFYINRFGKPLYGMFFEKYTEKLWGRHPSQIDPSWGAQRVKGLSIIKLLTNALGLAKKKETSLIDEFKYPKHGPGEYFECLAEKVTEMGGEIRFNEKVDKITLDGNKITSVNGTEYDYIFSSMPINDLVASMNDVPIQMQEIAKGLPYRDFITVGLLLKGVKIEAIDNWIYIQEPDVKLGRLQIFNNWSPYLVKDESKLWIGLEYFCTEGDEMWEMGDKDFITMAIGELEKIGVIDSADVLDATRINVKKAYPAYFDSYDEFPKLREWLGTIDNLFCIGRNGQHRYNNMDHSMRTAIEAVRVITDGAPKSKVWEVNTEEEYHEEDRKDKSN